MNKLNLVDEKLKLNKNTLKVKGIKTLSTKHKQLTNKQKQLNNKISNLKNQIKQTKKSKPKNRRISNKVKKTFNKNKNKKIKKLQRELQRTKNKLDKNNINRINSLNQINNKIINSFLTNKEHETISIKIDNNLANMIKNLIKNNHNNLNQKLVIMMKDNTGQTDGYTLNNKTAKRLNQISNFILRGGEEENMLGGSDREVAEFLSNNITEVEIRKIKKTKRNRQDGAFFKYTHNLKNLDLSRYGIYNKVEEHNYKHNCLYKALEAQGATKEQLEIYVNNTKTSHVPMSKLKTIANDLNITIKLYKFGDFKTNKNKETYYPNNYKNYPDRKIFKIGLIDEHYYSVDKETNITSFAINNYDKIKNEKDYNKIIKLKKGKYEKSNQRFIKSTKLFELLLENKDKLLTKITLNDSIMNTQYYNKVEEITDLNYVDTLRKVEYKETPEPEYKNIIFFDFETYTKVEEDKKYQEPYLVCSIDNYNNKKSFIGEDCAKQFLNSIEEDSLLIAHNATFDFNFLMKYLSGISIIKKGSSLMQYKGLHTIYKNNKKKNIKIIIKDSYKIITKPLRDFGKCFNLKVEKEIMNYNIYTEDSVKTNKYLISEAIKDFIDEEKEQFLKNIDRWNIRINKDYFNHIEYSRIYCELDCIVLKEGFNKFRDLILELDPDLDINNILTSSSFAHRYMLKNKVYEGVYEINGVVRRFIEQSCIGGRVCVKDNSKIKLNNVEVSDFDAVSLYPSAMVRLTEELGGILKGKPKVLKQQQLNKKFLDTTDGYFIDIKIKKVNKSYGIPILNYYDKENNKRNYVNKIDKDIILTVNKITFEDYINYHDIEYEIIRGYYFNEGRNTKMGDIIKNLFNERLRLKKEKNPLQEVLKLIMNSAYGKTIMKEIKTDYKITNGEKNFNNILYNKYNFINNIHKVKGSKDQYFIEIDKPVIKHYNLSHIGSEILSMSKRIMCEVMCTAEDIDIPVYYTDTDSMHLPMDKIQKLSEEFKRKYSRELIGKGLGQFHTDFDLLGVPKELEHTITATDCIFLGKKVYIDKLRGEDGKGGYIYGYHIRLKGVPTSCIKYKVEENHIEYSKDDKEYIKDELDLYEKLYNGETIDFDLTNNNTKVCFRFTKNCAVLTIQDFIRKISF